MRNIARYVSHFEKTAADLQGKLILDVGSGFPTFARECENFGIARAISLEKNFTSFGLHPMAQNHSPLELVIGRAEYLPFHKELFDLVIALFSVPILCQTNGDVSQVIDEMLRITRKNGEVWLSPITRSDKPQLNEWIDEKLTGLAGVGNYHLTFGSIQREIDGLPGRLSEFRYCIITKR